VAGVTVVLRKSVVQRTVAVRPMWEAVLQPGALPA
jgi:hypothetical protein